MKHEVFISHSSVDKEIAGQVCRFLESHQLPCWIAPRDVTPGKNYGAAILDAIDECSIFVLLLSTESNKSGQVVREVERAASSNSTIIPVRVEDVLPSRDLEFYVSSTHWLDAHTRPLDKHLHELHRAIKDWEARKKDAPSAVLHPKATTNALPLPATRTSSLSAGLLAGIFALVLLLVGLGAFWFLRSAKVAVPALTAGISPTSAESPVKSETPMPMASPAEPASTKPPPPAAVAQTPGESTPSFTPVEPVAAASPATPPLRPRRNQPLRTPATPFTEFPSLIREATASSEMQVANQVRQAALAFDGKANTSWAAQGDGVGQSITVYFKAPVTLTSVSILATAGSEPQFRIRNRVHTVRLTLSDGTNQLFTFEDIPKAQSFELARPATVTWATFHILTVFRGEKLNHTPIYEIGFNRGAE